MNHIYLTSYGDRNGAKKGIVKVNFDSSMLNTTEIFPIDGKANMVIETANHLIASVKNKENYLLFLTKEGKFVKKILTEYFYSYGQYIDDYLLLSSFESGVDSVLDLKDFSFYHSIHHRDGYSGNGRSHYIRKIKDKVIAVENNFQQLYIYDDCSLRKYQTIDFGEINVRLLAVSTDEKEAILNTEISNELIVFDTDDYHIKQRLCYSKKGYSSGNVLSKDGLYLCECVRNEDKVYVFKKKNHAWEIYKTFMCGKMPRDLMMIDHQVWVTCSDENCIQIFDLDRLKQIAEIPVASPVTFAIQN